MRNEDVRSFAKCLLLLLATHQRLSDFSQASLITSMTWTASMCVHVQLCHCMLQISREARTYVVVRRCVETHRALAPLSSYGEWRASDAAGQSEHWQFSIGFTRGCVMHLFGCLSVRPCSSFVLRISPVHYIIALTTCLCAPAWRPAALNMCRKKEAQEMRITNHFIHTLFIYNAYTHAYICMYVLYAL